MNVPTTPSDDENSNRAGATTPKRLLLFVEPDAAAAEKLAQKLEPLSARWDMRFLESGSQALEHLAQWPVEGIVATPQVSDMTGAALLNEVASLHPTTMRFIRCTPAEGKSTKDFAAPLPQQLSSELDAEAVGAAIRHAITVDGWMSSEAVKKLLGQMRKLPVLPNLYGQVLEQLQSPDGSMEVVAEMIGKDPVMTAKMLQLVNSAYFALAYQVTNAMDAVMFLGAERTKSLILLTKIFSQFDKTRCAGFDAEGLWKHLMSVAFASRAITMAETRNNKVADAAFTGGLLHDIGKLLLAENLPEQYSEMLMEAKRRTFPLQAIELATFGATHSELGACLLTTWGLPLPILEAIALHHTPLVSEDTDFSVLTAVHAANVIEDEKVARKGTPVVRMDPAYLARLDLIGRRNRWRELLDCPARPQDEDRQDRLQA
ncbi:MAG: hypothetical protein QOF48_1494 [Verrucomicrobiota bacterium]